MREKKKETGIQNSGHSKCLIVIEVLNKFIIQHNKLQNEQEIIFLNNSPIWKCLSFIYIITKGMSLQLKILRISFRIIYSFKTKSDFQ